MFDDELYSRLIETPGLSELGWTVIAGASLILAAAALLAFNKIRYFARGMGIVGVLVIMGALFVVHEQTVTERITNYVSVTRPRYPEDLRFQIRAVLIGLPIVAAAVMASVYFRTRRWLRSKVPAHLALGHKFFFHKYYDEALFAYNRAIKAAPELGEAYYHRGCVHVAKGEKDRALADFEKAIELEPSLSGAFLQRGKLLADQNLLDEAIADFEAVQNLRPNDPESILYRGFCAARRGNRDAAVSDFQRVLRLTNDHDYAGPAQDYLRLLGADPNGQTSPNGVALMGTEEPALDWVI
jgi:tetratricopeptide (TPR) repeat protein